jgi:hypothetical protein
MKKLPCTPHVINIARKRTDNNLAVGVVCVNSITNVSLISVARSLYLYDPSPFEF